MIEIRMPRLSDTMEEGAIASWHKHPGDRVEIGDVIVEIETDKATMDYEVYEAGTLSAILVDEGATVAIGTPIATLDDGKAAPVVPAAVAPAAVAEVAEPVATPPVATPLDATPSSVRAAAPAGASPAASALHAPAAGVPHSGPDGLFASPLVRRLAREHDLDLSRVTGTG